MAKLALGTALFFLVACGPEGPAPNATDVATEPVTTVAGRYLTNGSWLSHAYASTTSVVNGYLPNFLDRAHHDYAVNTIVLNLGTTQANTGTVASSGHPALGDFLDTIASYESAQNVHFQVLAGIAGNLDPTLGAAIDLSNPAITNAIITDAAQFCSQTVQGSHVTGFHRAFDGVLLDYEPSGPRNNGTDSTIFNNWKLLMENMRARFNGLGLSSKWLGVASPKYNDTKPSKWEWSLTNYYYMARHVDVLNAMTYDTGSTSGSAYQSWVETQTTEIMRAVSGVAYHDPTGHPLPTNHPKVFIGWPAYPASGTLHNPSYENTNYGSHGLNAAITALVNDTKDPSEGFFYGGMMFLTGEATSTDHSGYALYSTDWWWEYAYWLGR
jgi:hypothetical protein